MSAQHGPRLALENGSESLRALSAEYLTEYLDKIRLACEGLSDEQVWTRSTPHANSIGNLILHLCGNLSLWIRASLGGRPFIRDRAAEFSASMSLESEELFRQLEEVVFDCRKIIEGLDADFQARQHTIQGYTVSGSGALFHAVEHMSYHTGQIILIAKEMRDRTGDRLEFYPHLLGRARRE